MQIPRSQHFIGYRPSRLGALHPSGCAVAGPPGLSRAATLAVDLGPPGRPGQSLSLSPDSCGIGKSSRAACPRKLETNADQS